MSRKNVFVMTLFPCLRIKNRYGTPGTPILTIDDAIAANSFYTNMPGANYPINVGDVNKAFGTSDVVFEGFTNMGSQIHFHMEPQVFYSIPQEAGTLKVVGAFQVWFLAVCSVVSLNFCSINNLCNK